VAGEGGGKKASLTAELPGSANIILRRGRLKGWDCSASRQETNAQEIGVRRPSSVDQQPRKCGGKTQRSSPSAKTNPMPARITGTSYRW